MAANGNLIFQDTNKATFVGANSNVVIDTVHASFGVGVDVNGPTSNLHVVGNAYVTSNLEVGTANLFVDTVNSRVGIGTTSPNEKLDVYGTGMRIHDPAASPKIDLLRGGSSRNPDTDTFGASDYVDWRITANGPKLNFQNQYTGGNSGNLLNVMTLEHGTGNVGIGVTDPPCKLTIDGGTGVNSTGGVLAIRQKGDTIDDGITLTSSSANSTRLYKDGSGHFYIHTGGSDTVFQNQTGNVGIGTNNPQQKLEVHGNILLGQNDIRSFIHCGGDMALSSDNDVLIVSDGNDTSGGGGADIIFGAGSAINMDSSRNFTFAQAYPSAVPRLEHMRILGSNGRVGIGTTSPGCILDVAMQHGDISSPMVHFRANRDGASQGDGNILKLENSGNRSDVELLQCVSGSNTEFVVKANGNVGIGFNDPGTLGTHAYGGSRRILHLMGWMYYGDNSGDNETWVTGIGTSSSGNANHYLWRFSLNGAALYNVAYIGYNNGVYYDVKTFTGQHRAARIENIPPKDAHTYEGLIVVADKNAYESVNGEKRRGKEAITTNEAVPFLTLSKKVRDKTCFGVISASEDPDKREQRFGNFVSIHPKEGGDTFIFVNSLGEGAMWVSNVNGALESGDFITTSDVPGYGMKQDDDLLHNYTVAKITMDCDFNPPTQPVQHVKKKLGEVKYWVQTKYINVTHEEYDTLDETERTIEYIDSNPIYKKIVKEDSLEEDDDHTELDIRMEMVNDVDENGQMIWEDHPTETEKAYKIRYLDADGNITDEANAVHKAAFVGCTYHCG